MNFTIIEYAIKVKLDKVFLTKIQSIDYLKNKFQVLYVLYKDISLEESLLLC